MDRKLEGKAVFTTGELSRILEVNINTVVRWIETGQLKGYSLPGSNTRRIRRDDLIEFLTKRDLLQTETPCESIEILLVSSSPNMARRFRSAVKRSFGYSLNTADCAFGAGFLCAGRVPDVIFIHLGHADFDPESYRESLERRPQLTRARLVAITDKEVEEDALAAKGFIDGLSTRASGNEILEMVDALFARSRQSAVRFPPPRH